MWGRNIKWCVGIILAVALTISVTMTLQNWQRSHFDCSGELVMEYPDIRGDISVRYVFNGSNGVAILRGKITDNNGEKLAVNQNVWFTFPPMMMITLWNPEMSLQVPVALTFIHC